MIQETQNPTQVDKKTLGLRLRIFQENNDQIVFFFDSKHKKINEQEKDWQLKQKKLRVHSDFGMNSTATVVMNSTATVAMNSTTTVSPHEQYSFFFLWL